MHTPRRLLGFPLPSRPLRPLADRLDVCPAPSLAIMDPPMPYPALLTQILHQPDKVVADIPAIADLTALSASLDGLKASYGRRLAAVQSGKRQVGARRAAELEHEMRVARAEEARIAAREKAEREKVEGEERERKERKEREREREKEERERVAVVAEQQRVKKEAAATAKAEAETKSRLEKQQQQQQQKQQQQMQKKTLSGGGSAPPATSVKQEENEGPSAFSCSLPSSGRPNADPVRLLCSGAFSGARKLGAAPSTATASVTPGLGRLGRVVGRDCVAA